MPQIDPAQHRLMVHGAVERPSLFTMDDLKRFPAVSVVHFHECSGNSGSQWQESTLRPTVQAAHGLLSCAEWTGVPVRTILNEVGWRPGGTWLLCEGADAAGLTRSVPSEKAMADGLLVYGQSGEALRPSQGYPLRLILPGWEGNINVKWLRRIEVGNAPWETREETSKYTDLLPDGSARQFTFVMEAKSVITYPSGGQTIPGNGFWEICGYAWSGRGKIVRVDVSTDGGESWGAATLQEPVLPVSLTRFRFPWTWDGQPALLQSRAVDETGYVQPTIGELVTARRELGVPHERDHDLGRGRERGGDECLPIARDASAPAGRPAPRRLPAGTSTSPPMGPACQRAAARCRRGKPCLPGWRGVPRGEGGGNGRRPGARRRPRHPRQ